MNIAAENARTPFKRHVLAFGLGAITAFAAITGIDYFANKTGQTRPEITYAVGVMCTSPDAQVTEYVNDENLRVHCLESDGEPQDVTSLTSLDTDAVAAGKIHGYNAVVPMRKTGAAIVFGIDGSDGTAMIYENYTNGNTSNDVSTGIVRVYN